jgi:hypothetical protein
MNLKEKKKSPNSKYWRDKADKEVTKYYTGRPCTICGTTYQTCGHHLVERSLSAFLRHNPLNIVALCTKHHKFSNDMAAHSKNPLAVKAFIEWIRDNKPESYKLLETYKQFRAEKYSYRENYEEWKQINEDTIGE